MDEAFDATLLKISQKENDETVEIEMVVDLMKGEVVMVVVVVVTVEVIVVVTVVVVVEEVMVVVETVDEMVDEAHGEERVVLETDLDEIGKTINSERRWLGFYCPTPSNKIQADLWSLK